MFGAAASACENTHINKITNNKDSTAFFFPPLVECFFGKIERATMAGPVFYKSGHHPAFEFAGAGIHHTAPQHGLLPNFPGRSFGKRSSSLFNSFRPIL